MSSSGKLRRGELWTAAYTVASSTATPAQRLAAVRTLAAAPPDGRWRRTLIAALCDNDAAVATAARDACLALLRSSQQDPAGQDALIEAMLDFCRLDTGAETDAMRADLIDRVVTFLEEEPLGHDHLRARLLASARPMPLNYGQRKSARSFSDAQQRLALDLGRSDSRMAREIVDHRRFVLYTEPGADEAMLLGWLDRDHHVPLDQLDRTWFAVYRRMLAVQSYHYVPDALQRAFSNLIKWLGELPQEMGTRGNAAVVRDLRAAAAGKPWEDLAHPVNLHLAAHAELLPGPDDPGDLFRLLRERHTHHGAEPLLVLGLQVLRGLPGMRTRIPELCEYLLSDALMNRGLPVWEAACDLVAGLVTGLTSAEVAIADDQAGQGEADARRRRLLREQQQLLAGDAQLREVLNTLAWDTRRNDEVRRTAWRTLLSVLPHDRGAYYARGLADPRSELFDVTLEAAGQFHQRDAWTLLAGTWGSLAAGEQNAERRRSRLTTLGAPRGALRTYEAVTRVDDGPGPLIRLALDDDDAAVRRAALNAIQMAGYTAELQREVQRRTLLQRSEQLAELNGELIRVEGERTRMAAEARTLSVRRAELALEQQGNAQQLKLVTTNGWIETAEIGIDLDGITARVAIETRHVAELGEVLQLLQQAIYQQMHQSLAVRRQAEELVSQQEMLEDSRERLIEQQQEAVAILSRERVHQSELEVQLRKLPAPRPRRVNDADEEAARQERARFEQVVAQHTARCDEISAAIEESRASQLMAQRTVDFCLEQVEGIDASLGELSEAVRDVRSRAARIERELSNLRNEFDAGEAERDATMQRIAGLQAEANRLRKRLERQRQAQRDEVARLERASQACGAQIAANADDLSRLVQAQTAANAEMDRTRTEADRTAADIRLGRERYEGLVAEAETQSAESQAAGEASQYEFENTVHETQANLLWYAHHVGRAVAQERAYGARGG